MQFGFGYQPHQYLPHWYDEMTVAYTGTHDNDTTLGWWRRHASEREKLEAQSYLGFDPDDPESIPWSFVRSVIGSPARYGIVPLQDILALGSEARMNTPSHANGNWTWRYAPGKPYVRIGAAPGGTLLRERPFARPAGRSPGSGIFCLTSLRLSS